MRDGWLADAKTLAQLADANAGAFVLVATMTLATAGQAKKDRQPVWMGQSLEKCGQIIHVHISMVIDES
jgi:hypothetical protein